MLLESLAEMVHIGKSQFLGDLADGKILFRKQQLLGTFNAVSLAEANRTFPTVFLKQQRQGDGSKPLKKS